MVKKKLRLKESVLNELLAIVGIIFGLIVSYVLCLMF